MSIIFLETLNIEWGQIDPKGNRRVKNVKFIAVWKVVLASLGFYIILEKAS